MISDSFLIVSYLRFGSTCDKNEILNNKVISKILLRNKHCTLILIKIVSITSNIENCWIFFRFHHKQFFLFLSTKFNFKTYWKLIIRIDGRIFVSTFFFALNQHFTSDAQLIKKNNIKLEMNGLRNKNYTNTN